MRHLNPDRIKIGLIILIGLVMWFIPTPEGLSHQAWHLTAIFVATIIALILSPYPLGVIAIFSLTLVAALKLLQVKEVFSGFGNPTIWMIACAFFISRAFIKTGFSRRIGYLFINKFGKTSLGLSYGLVLTDLIFAPAMPSTTARCGGIITPLIRAISETFGSTPEEGTSRKIGAYLTQCTFQCNSITSAMFVTAMAGNPIVVSLASAKSITITWSQWALAACVPGVLCLLIIPLVLYRFFPPILKDTHTMRTLASEKLTEMGKLSKEEKIVLGVLLGLIILWIAGDALNIDATLTAFIGLSALLITRTLSWADVVGEKEAWHTVVWFAVLFMLASKLNSLGVIDWLGQTISHALGDLPLLPLFLLLVLIYYYIHYLMASSVAHIQALYLIFVTLAINAGAPPLLTALIFGMFSNLYMSTTHYSGGPAPILFGSGYVSLSTWWKIGFLMSLLVIPLWLGSGAIWWKLLGLY